MTDFFIAELAYPQADVEPGAIKTVLDATEDISAAIEMSSNGTTDNVDHASTWLAMYHPQEEQEVVLFVAVDGTPEGLDADGRTGLPVIRESSPIAHEDVLGTGTASYSLHEHRGSNAWVGVRADRRREGIGRELYAAVEQYVRAGGRSLVQAWASCKEGTGEDALTSKEGPFRIAPDAGTHFAQVMGYSLAQAERHSIQQLGSAELEPVPAVPGYSFLGYGDGTPEPLLPIVARLHQAMSTAAPSGDFDVEEQIWDADRVRRQEAEQLLGYESLTVLVIEDATGEPAGYTVLGRKPEHPEAGQQWNTLVLPGHRGHGIGRAAKIANMHQARERWPETVRIHTWNAAENDHMWAINEDLGYEVAGVDVGWQKKLD